MGSLGAQLKGMNWKEFAINHCEKMVLGMVGVFVASSLASTQWKSFPTQPEEFDDAVKKAKTAYSASRWPEENQKDFQARDLGDVVAGVTQGIQQRANDIYTFGTPWVRPIYPPKLKRGEVNWLALEEPIADSGKVLLAFAPAAAANTTPQMEVVVQGSAADRGPRNTDLDDDSKPRGIDGPRNPGAVIPMPMPMPTAPAGAGHGGGGGGRRTPPGRNAGGGGHAAGGSVDPSMMMYAEGAAMPGGAGATGRNVEAKGFRFVSVRAVFPLKRQLEEIRKALQLETTTQAWDQMKFGDFKIQRQTALAGDQPWAGQWEDVDIQTALDILGRVDFDVDVVEEKYRDPVITMPLPFRETGTWKSHASHPQIKKLLTEEEATRQEALNRAMVETGEKLKLKQGGAGGFSGIQHNTRDLQRQIMGNSSAQSTFNELYQQMTPEMMGGGSMHPGMGGGHGASGPASYPMPIMAGGGHGAVGPGMSGMAPVMSGGGMMSGNAMAMGGGMGAGAGISIPEVLLFRYLDFDVVPGNAYRYRVQLVMKNPNLGWDANELKDPSSANGETRDTKVSTPTNPVVIEDELKLFVNQVNSSTTGNLTANIDVLQWLTDSGSYVMAPFLKLARGDQIAAVTGKDPKTGEKNGGVEVELLRPANQTFKKERIDFETPNVLLNMTVSNVVSPEDNPDLELPTKRIATKLEEVVMVNRFGEIVDVDNVTQKTAQSKATGIIKAQDEAFQSFKVSAAAPGAGMSGLAGYLGNAPGMDAAGMPGAPGKGKPAKRSGSSLKRGAMPGMSMPGMSMPGSAN